MKCLMNIKSIGICHYKIKINNTSTAHKMFIRNSKIASTQTQIQSSLNNRLEKNHQIFQFYNDNSLQMVIDGYQNSHQNSGNYRQQQKAQIFYEDMQNNQPIQIANFNMMNDDSFLSLCIKNKRTEEIRDKRIEDRRVNGGQQSQFDDEENKESDSDPKNQALRQKKSKSKQNTKRKCKCKNFSYTCLNLFKYYNEFPLTKEIIQKLPQSAKKNLNDYLAKGSKTNLYQLHKLIEIPELREYLAHFFLDKDRKIFAMFSYGRTQKSNRTLWRIKWQRIVKRFSVNSGNNNQILGQVVQLIL